MLCAVWTNIKSLLRLKKVLQIAVSRSLKYMLVKESCIAGASRQNLGKRFIAVANVKGILTGLLFQGCGLVWHNSMCSALVQAISKTIV